MNWVMDALLRIEKKLDEVIKCIKVPGTIIQPLDSEGQVCQLCNHPVVYSRDPISGTIWRSCGCVPNIKGE